MADITLGEFRRLTADLGDHVPFTDLYESDVQLTKGGTQINLLSRVFERCVDCDRTEN